MYGKSEIQLLSYKVITTYFQLNEDYALKNKPIRIKPNFNRKVSTIEGDVFKVTLSVSIDQENSEFPLPFEAKVVITGDFRLQGWMNNEVHDIAINSTTAILFPYLRNTLSSITLQANIPPYVLPIMNMASLFRHGDISTE